MSKIRIRDPYQAEFEIESAALPYWQHREGYEVLGPVSEHGDEPALEAAPVTAQPETPGTSHPIKKAAVRPASEDKE
ncbi:hypothetical protein ACFYY8_31625 [Streptosporangium sp. NPDC001559]|uniref:hypothetical protein n=1 Tax=Streptosporangium sp. NPDC001559 TaxID=3366187 RepID=UPI0036E15022